MSLPTSGLAALLAQLQSLEAAVAASPHAALPRILAAFGSLPANLQDATQALKKAGAWPDKPLAPNTPASPYYIVDPCAIEVENMPSALLQAQLTEQAQQVPPPADAYGNAEVTLTRLPTL